MTGPFLAPTAERLLDAAGWPHSWGRSWVAGLLAALVILAATVVIGWLVKNVLAGALRRLAAKTTTDLDDQIVALAEKPAFRLVRMVGIYLAVLELPVPRPLDMAVTGILLILVIFVAVRLVTRIGILLLLAYGRRVSDVPGRQRYEKDYVPLLSKILGTILTLMGLIIVLRHFGQDVSSVVAALGIGGLAISFAAKETLGNMFAGFTLLLDRPFRPGDRIKMATGEIGDVLEVGTRSTRIRLLDSNMLIVPNSELVNNRVVNFNFPDPSMRGALEVGIAYGSDIERAKAIVLDAIRAQPEVIDPPPSVLLAAFGDSALVLAASYVVAEFADAGAVQDRVRVRVYNELGAAGIKIPYPTRELIHVAPAPAAAAPPTGKP
jgi:small-conductance mechanosensitive channel